MAKRTKKLIEINQTEESVRLNKFLSDAGVCSRREADEHIAAGHVTVDGITAVMGTKVSKGQKVIFQGKVITKDEQLVLIAFNKPRGIVCTTNRSEKDNIIDYINYGKRIYPIGRLDKDSEGLILLTNDGDIVNKILRAGNNHEKEYIVTVNKAITSEFFKGMSEGVPILDTVTRPCKLKAIDKFTFHIILTQGLNRQIRRMCEYFDYKVMTLKRIRIMNINLGHLHVGGYRNVTEKEIEGLKELLSNSVNQPLSKEEIMNFWGEDSNDDMDHEITYEKRSSFKNQVNKSSYGKNNSNGSHRRNENHNVYGSKRTLENKNNSERKSAFGKKSVFEKKNAFEKNEYDKKNAFEKKNDYGKKNAFEKKNEYEKKNAFEKKNDYKKKNTVDKKNTFKKNGIEKMNVFDKKSSFEKREVLDKKSASAMKGTVGINKSYEKKNADGNKKYDRNTWNKSKRNSRKSYGPKGK